MSLSKLVGQTAPRTIRTQLQPHLSRATAAMVRQLGPSPLGPSLAVPIYRKGAQRPFVQGVVLSHRMQTRELHSFNIGCMHLLMRIQALLSSDIKKIAKQLPEPGQKIQISGKEKVVIGYRAAPADEPETHDLPRYYGNPQVAAYYAKCFQAGTSEKTFVIWMVLGDSLPEKEHHDEPRFEGNWHPLSLKGQKELQVEQVQVAGFKEGELEVFQQTWSKGQN